MLATQHAKSDYFAERVSGPYIREHRLAGSNGHIVEVAQPAGDFSDVPTSDLVLIRALSSGISFRVDVGGGSIEGKVRRNDLLIVPPETAMSFLIHNDHVVQCLVVPGDTLRPHLEEARQSADPFDFGPLHSRLFRSPTIASLLDSLWSATQRRDGAGRLFVDGAILSIAGELLSESQRAMYNSDRVLSAWQIARLEEFVRGNLSNDICVADLASEVGLSPSHFARAFKTSMHETPHRYVMRCRVECAQELLGQTSLTVTEIACMSGFSSSQHMATVFRRTLATTPRECRADRQAGVIAARRCRTSNPGRADWERGSV